MDERRTLRVSEAVREELTEIIGFETFLANAGLRNYLFIRLRTDTGLAGIGEATLECGDRRASERVTIPGLRRAMEEYLAEYLHHLALEKHASEHTVKSYREDLTQALGFFHERLGNGSLQPAQITTRQLRAYLAWLSEQGYAKTTIARRIAAVRSWLRFLCRQGVLDEGGEPILRSRDAA